MCEKLLEITSEGLSSTDSKYSWCHKDGRCWKINVSKNMKKFEQSFNIFNFTNVCDCCLTGANWEITCILQRVKIVWMGWFHWTLIETLKLMSM